MVVSSPIPRTTGEIALTHMSTQVPVAGPDETVGQIVGKLREAAPMETSADVAVVEDGRLLGLIPIELLLAAPDTAVGSSIMDSDPPVVGPGLDQEMAALKAVAHHESSLAVVDESGSFLGLIPPYRMLGVLLEEHREDLARLSGFLHQSESARSASEESVARRLWHRFPWLVVGLAAALTAAAIVAGFEGGLSSHIELAFFIPGIVYIADAVGTQTEVLVVRGLSVGVSIRRIIGREIVTGLAIGLILGLLSFPAVLYLVDRPVALAVSTSIWGASAVATLVAMSLPWALSRAGFDPAFGSGPLATVIQDLLSLSIYFMLAGVFVL
jgi:magnesium transporter